ncbi:magnesium transporter MgtE N-terminal domain-containing protein [Mycobacterium sp. WMMD1722]|uniref:PRC-barrel domain containing protein n=1 Tax=Mycobacterium sp. WMMD1722 TaxID=3404117 RepID=UPI003BF497AA
MILLSEVLGCDVRGPDGRTIGSLADLTLRLGAPHGLALIERVLVHRRREPDLLLPWAAVVALRRHGVAVSDSSSAYAAPSIASALAADELLLKRDVLDTQIVDIGGERLARVADVILARRRDGRVEIVAAEVGFGAVLRRLGWRSAAARLRHDAVAWSDLYLTSDRGHTAQLATARSAARRLDARDLAVLVARLDTESAADLLTASGPAVAADVIDASHPAVGERMLRALPQDRAADVVSVMPVARAAHWRRTLATPGYLRGRHLLRFRVWPRRRHPGRAR